MNNQEISMDQTALMEMLKEIFEHNQQTQSFIKSINSKLSEKDKIIADCNEQVPALINSFENKYANLQVQAPKPDLSSINTSLASGLMTIKEAIEQGPKPVIRQFRLMLFPEQVRSAEYYGIMLTRLILGLLGLVFLVFGYLLLNKMIK